MRALLDTCVVRELKQPEPDPFVREAIGQIGDGGLFLSVLTVGEIGAGIAALPAGKKKRQLTSWLRGLEEHFSDRLLAVDAETATIWGEVSARVRKEGLTLGSTEGLLAATALRHGLHLVTRSTPSLVATGVLLFDPWPHWSESAERVVNNG